MKKALLLLTFLAWLVLPTRAEAAEDWTIDNFQTSIVVKETGVVAISETIEVNFFNLNKRGIYRDIPYIYEDGSGKKYIELDVSSVERDGAVEKYTTSFSGGYVRIVIGDEDKTIIGRHRYTINYKVIGILQSFEGYDELYWNATGNYWQVPIKKASATVTLPKDGISQLACYQGSFGSKESCTSKVESPRTASFSTSRALNEEEGVTVAVGYIKGLVPILEGKKPKEITDDLFSPISMVLFLLTLVSGLAAVVFVWHKNGRDFWFRSRFVSDPAAKPEPRPIGGYETVVVEFIPPENLRPGELGALLDESVGNIEVTATIIDLANRGFLAITEEKKKWVFGSTDYTFKKVNKETVGLLQYETYLLTAVFKDGDEIKLSKLRNKFYKDLPEMKKHLYQDLVAKKFFVENPSSVRTRYFVAGVIVALLGGVCVWLGFQAIIAYSVSFGAAIIIVGIVVLIFANFMPRKTAHGRQMYVRAKGYRMFVATAEKYRQQFFEKRNLFNEVLPYAIVFGLTEKFAKDFAKMGIEPENPSWYRGSSAFNAAIFGASLASFSNSFSNTIASSPSSRGSSGGGSSGGGFGGGGGGSW